MKYTVQDGFPYYIELVGDLNYKELFNSKATFNWLHSISEEQSLFRYEQGKWSIKQIVEHITDHECIMTYRSLRFSRNDKTLLPGYDQDVLVSGSRFDKLSFVALVDDFENVRAATNSFIKGLSDEQLQRTGKAWKFKLTVEDF